MIIVDSSIDETDTLPRRIAVPRVNLHPRSPGSGSGLVGRHGQRQAADRPRSRARLPYPIRARLSSATLPGVADFEPTPGAVPEAFTDAPITPLWLFVVLLSIAALACLVLIGMIAF